MQIVPLTVTLEDVDPPVTRVLEVARDMALDRLHLTLQAAMGWQDAHLYAFEAGEARWSHPAAAADMGWTPADRASLGDALAATGAAPLIYTYDFGDDWRHLITAGAPVEPVAGHRYPRLTAARGRCPPEDTGGPPGYAMLLEALADPDHPEHAEMRAWAGGTFDARVADFDDLAFEVAKLARRWRKRR